MSRSRLIYETELEKQARMHLRAAGRAGSLLALDRAAAALDRAVTQPAAADLRARILELGEALYQSIGMQLSVDRYKAIAVSRGANLDTLDFPLNNRLWLELQFAEIRRLEARRNGWPRSKRFSTAPIPAPVGSTTISERRQAAAYRGSRSRIRQGPGQLPLDPVGLARVLGRDHRQDVAGRHLARWPRAFPSVPEGVVGLCGNTLRDPIRDALPGSGPVGGVQAAGGLCQDAQRFSHPAACKRNLRCMGSSNVRRL